MLNKQKIESGLYHSSSKVVHEAFRLPEGHDSMKSVKLNALRKDIQAGLR